MFEMSVKTASGREFEVDHAATSTAAMQRMLYIEFIGYKMMDIVPVFSNVEEVKTIRGYLSGVESKVFEGYTELAEAFFVPGREGHLRIRLDTPIETETFEAKEATTNDTATVS